MLMDSGIAYAADGALSLVHRPDAAQQVLVLGISGGRFSIVIVDQGAGIGPAMGNSHNLLFLLL